MHNQDSVFHKVQTVNVVYRMKAVGVDCYTKNIYKLLCVGKIQG